MTDRAWCAVPRIILLAATLALCAGGGCGRFAMETGAGAKTVLRVGTSGDYAPFSVRKEGVLEGLDIDVAKRLAQDLGRPVEFRIVPWPTLSAATKDGDFDVAMGGITMRADRALVGRYTRPYAAVGIVALVREAYVKRFGSPEALNSPGVRIAVNAGGHLEQVARAQFPRARIDAVPDNHAVLQRLLGGKADAVLSDTAEARDWLRPGLRVIGPFRFDYKAYLLPAGEDTLAVQVDQWMAARETDGWLPAQRERWLGMPAKTNPATATREAIAALIGLRLDLMVPMAAAKRAAGKTVEDTAREEAVIASVRDRSSRPEYGERVYRQLIELAKAVQQNAPDAPATVSIDDVRTAIGRVDDQLVRELNRAPAAPLDTWRGALSRAVSAPGVDKAGLDSLAAALETQ
jgi:cyclohexadienyl dehydratase